MALRSRNFLMHNPSPRLNAQIPALEAGSGRGHGDCGKGAGWMAKGYLPNFDSECSGENEAAAMGPNRNECE